MPTTARIALIGLACLLPATAHAEPTGAPTSVREVADSFDPRREPLDIQRVRQWERDQIVYQYVTFHVGVFKGTPARIAAYYAAPRNATGLPGLLHIHGGGQRAFLHEVEFYARRGYPCLSINWGGREMEDAKPGEPNTHWGAVDPTQNNVPGYFNLKPGDKYLDPFESPRNNNWYLLTLAARRGLTFLERQPEVDPHRLGVYGHSMGGNLTVYVAGTDERVKAAAPSVGGSGFRTLPRPLLPQQVPERPVGDLALFNATLGFESYAPHIRAPVLWLGSTNDFHGVMDDTYRTGDLIPHRNVRYAFTPHMNHRFTPAFAITRPLWFDQYLKSSFTFPQTPQARLHLATPDGVPRLELAPDAPQHVAQVQVYYSIDPDPRARFWRSASPTAAQGRWSAPLPFLTTDQPLFAFANVHYSLPQAAPSEPHAAHSATYALSSTLLTASPADLQNAKATPTDQPSALIDDFTQGWRDWYLLSPDNPHHWEYSTRKLADPKWRGRADQSLAIDIQSDQANELVLVITENAFRGYRGPQRTLTAVASLTGGAAAQRLSLKPGHFTDPKGQPLRAWDHVDLLSIRAYHESEGRLLGSKRWAGRQPTLKRLAWEAQTP